MVAMEKDDDMTIFFEMRRREVEEDGLPALNNSDEFDVRGSDNGLSPVSKRTPSLHVDADDFLNIENDATDYDWLLTPPDIPLFPLLDMESQKHICSQVGTINGQSTTLKTKPADTKETPNSSLEASAPNLGPTKTGNKTRSASKKTISADGKFAATKPSRSSTPNSRTPLTSSSKSKKPSTRSSIPSQSGSRLSNPTGKQLAPVASKSTPRSSTPIRKESSSAVGPCISAPLDHSSNVAKLASSKSKNAASVRDKIPIGKPHEALDSHELPLRSRISLPERAASTSRGRPGISNRKIVSSGVNLHEKQRQKSCSPPKARVPNISGFSGRNLISAWNRAHSRDADEVNPLVIGSQMVERVVNMRKLAQPKPDGHFGQNKSTEKSSLSRDNSGFGLSLSKKSLDMAIRHMSIKGSPSGKLKPLNTKNAAPSGHSTPTGSTKSSTTNVTDSPFATSSDTSSDPMVHFNSNYSYRSVAIEKAIGGEKVIT